ncbi:MAG: NAD-dependent epimerase/dehydratase family protein [Solirubrobacterales bacterium]|nr:NAD-dependent epimerase/dehydratase family protein [Solirubrobacterales bacterium]
MQTEQPHPPTTQGPLGRSVVTGCAGFVGSHLAEALLKEGQTVVGVDVFNDNYSRGLKISNLRHLTEWDSFEFVPIDLAQGDLAGVVAESDVVYHLAGEPGVRSSWGDRYETYLRNNLRATQQLLESIKSMPDVRFVYASSSSVYGDSETMPTSESETLRPLSPYGQTKAAMELLCDLYRKSHGVDAVGLRYFTVYGPRQRPDMAFHRFCRAAINGEPIAVFGDGLQTRDFTFVSDVVAATRAAGHMPVVDHLFNIGGGSPASVRDALSIIEALAEKPLDVTYGEVERGDVRDTAANTTLARTQLAFDPRIGLEEGLAAEFAWVREAIASNLI